MVKSKIVSTIIVIMITLSLLLSLQSESAFAIPKQAVSALNPKLIPKFVNQLVIPPVYSPTVVNDPATGKVISHDYIVDVSEFSQQILPAPLPATKVWGYGGMVKDPRTGKPVYFHNAPGATFEAVKGIPINVKWVNKLKGPYLFATDPTLHWANPNMMSMEPSKPWPKFPGGFPDAQNIVAIAPHLHGGETQSIYDGHPEAWFTADGKKGPTYSTSDYKYLNTQPPATLWYHDHALGLTRINVYSGLAGFYLLRDPNDALTGTSSNKAAILPSGKYDVPLVIQDRKFNSDGSLLFDKEGINPEIHPYWTPEFFGDTIVVNGKAWPNFNVDRNQYRFHVLNGSNARFYNLSFSNHMKFTQIMSDGGYLPAPVTMNSLVLAPGERADILIDFSKLKANSKIILKNDASAPYPSGDKADPSTVGQIMQFTISPKAGKQVVPQVLPPVLNHIPKLTPNSPERILTLNEVMGPEGPEDILLNGQKWEVPVSETPTVGSTEDWVIANLTEDTHPIHLHLVQFQLVNRQAFNAEEYEKAWISLNGQPPLKKQIKLLDVSKYLIGKQFAPAPNETGWKDTVRMNPKQITRIRVRFAPQDAKSSEALPGVNLFPFDPTIGPGYVWHCHIIDHEDNEMMRPLIIKP